MMSHDAEFAPDPIPPCGARAEGGPCALPAGHNMGQADVPANHVAAPTYVPVPVDRLARLEAIEKAYTDAFGEYSPEAYELIRSSVIADAQAFAEQEDV